MATTPPILVDGLALEVDFNTNATQTFPGNYSFTGTDRFVIIAIAFNSNSGLNSVTGVSYSSDGGVTNNSLTQIVSEFTALPGWGYVVFVSRDSVGPGFEPALGTGVYTITKNFTQSATSLIYRGACSNCSGSGAIGISPAAVALLSSQSQLTTTQNDSLVWGMTLSGAPLGGYTSELPVTEIARNQPPEIFRTFYMTGALSAPYPTTQLVKMTSRFPANTNTYMANTSVELRGTAVATIPILSATPLTPFTYAFGTGPSVAQSFTITGTDIQNDLLVTPSVNYEISEDGVTYQSTVITLSAPPFTTDTIFVRLKAGLAVGVYNEFTSVASIGATTINVITEGTVSVAPEVPTLNAVPSPLLLSYDEGSGPSDPQQFTITSENLAGATVTVTPPTNYEISESLGTGYTTSPIPIADPTLSGKVMYVRLVAGLSVNTYNGTVSISASGATNVGVDLQGEVYTAPVSNNTSNFLIMF